MAFGLKSSKGKKESPNSTPRGETPTTVEQQRKAIVGRDGVTHPYGSGRPGSLDANGASPAKQQALDRAKAEKAKIEPTPTDRLAVEKAAAKKVLAEKAAAERAAAEKAAAEKAAAEKAAAGKAAAEKAAAEEAQLIQRQAEAAAERAKKEAEDAQWKLELAKMTSTEAFGAQLASKIGVDLSGLRKQIEKGHRALEATKAELVALEGESASASKASAAAIGALEEEKASVGAVTHLLAAVEADAASLAREVASSTDLEAQRRQNTLSVRARLEEELSEAQVRQRAAADRKAALDREMAALVAEIEAAEQAAESELAHTTDVALAARLKAELAQRSLKVYAAEAERLHEEEPAVRSAAAKAARAAESRAQVKALAAQLEADSQAMEALAKKERAVELAGESAQSAAAAAVALFEAQIEAARKLVAQHDASEATLRGATERDGVGAAEAELLGVAGEFVRTQRAAAQSELAALEAALVGQKEKADAASGARQLELRQLRAEAKAMRVASEHRRQFHRETSERLAAEEREAAEAAVGGRAACVEMVRAEHENAKQAHEALAAAAAAAEGAREEKARAVRELKASHRGRLGALDSRLGSEGSVCVEQQRYVESLEARLRHEALQCVDGATADGAAGRGRAVVDEAAAAVAKFVSELRGRSAACESTLAEAKLKEAKEAKRGEAEAKRLAEAREATGEALQKLEHYEESLANEQRQATPRALPSSRVSDVIEIGAPTPRSSLAVAPGAPPAIPEDAIEAARLIDRMSAGSAKHEARPTSPVEVSKLQM